MGFIEAVHGWGVQFGAKQKRTFPEHANPRFRAALRAAAVGVPTALLLEACSGASNETETVLPGVSAAEVKRTLDINKYSLFDLTAKIDPSSPVSDRSGVKRLATEEFANGITIKYDVVGQSGNEQQLEFQRVTIEKRFRNTSGDTEVWGVSFSYDSTTKDMASAELNTRAYKGYPQDLEEATPFVDYRSKLTYFGASSTPFGHFIDTDENSFRTDDIRHPVTSEALLDFNNDLAERMQFIRSTLS